MRIIINNPLNNNLRKNEFNQFNHSLLRRSSSIRKNIARNKLTHYLANIFNIPSETLIEHIHSYNI